MHVIERDGKFGIINGVTAINGVIKLDGSFDRGDGVNRVINGG